MYAKDELVMTLESIFSRNREQVGSRHQKPYSIAAFLIMFVSKKSILLSTWLSRSKFCEQNKRKERCLDSTHCPQRRKFIFCSADTVNVDSPYALTLNPTGIQGLHTLHAISSLFEYNKTSYSQAVSRI